MHSALRALILAAPCALAACSPPTLIKPYRMEIQQGNYVSQDMVSQLKPGMSKDQVRFILGTPLVTDIFHADRWDYVYYREVPNRAREERKLAVIFEDGKLARVLGDVVPAAPKEEPAPAAPRESEAPEARKDDKSPEGPKGDAAPAAPNQAAGPEGEKK